MKLYSYWRSSCAWRVRIVLHLKKLEYAYVPVNIAPGVNEQQGAAYAAINRFQQVPTLEWIEESMTRRLTQSTAIIEYLEELRPDPPLLPRELLKRARVREAVQIINSGIQPLQNTWLQGRLRELAGDAPVPAFVQNVIQRGLTVLEAHAQIHAGRYSIGDEVTLADVYLVPQLYNARRANVDLTPYTRLIAIERELETLPELAAARPERQPDAAQA
jgi:maleylpyruvate isomerase